jgi:flagellar biogenesis protein FliO
MLKPLLIAAAMLLVPGGPDAEKPATPKPTKTVAQADAKAPADIAGQQAVPKPGQTAKPTVDLNADNPPPTSWDKSLDTAATKSSTEPVDENTLAQQLLQTLIALVFVCLLIYLVGRFGLSRLTSLRTGAPTQTLSLNEKLSLDAKNALYIVEVKGRGKLLLGGGDQGLNLICNLDEDSAFEKSMNRTQSPLVDSTPGAEVQREQHG